MNEPGFGTYKITAKEMMQPAVTAAVECGYRLFDTAAVYGNEQLLCDALRNTGIPMDEFHIVSKIWITDIEHKRIRSAAEQILKNCRMDKISLLLLHWPVTGCQPAAWEAMLQLERAGLTGQTGVSNYTVRHLEQLLDAGLPAPAVNQIECTPFLTQEPLREYCSRHGIRLQSYSPLARGRKLDHPLLLQISRETGATPAQVMISWALHRGITPLPKSTRPDRIRENFEARSVVLSTEQTAALDALNEELHIARDPALIPL